MNIYQHDFDFLIETITDSHPNVFAVLTEDNFRQQVELTREKLTTVTDKNAAAVIYQQFLALLKDGHTAIQSFWGQSGSFGLTIALKQDCCYIKNISTDFESKLIGRKIETIGNLPALTAVEKIKSIISAENDYFQNYLLSTYCRNPAVLKLLGIINDDLLTVRLAENEELLSFAVKESIAWRQPAKHPITARKTDDFSYQIMDNYCYFQFNQFFDKQAYEMYKSFNYFSAKQITELDGRYSDFRDFLQTMFSDIVEQNIQNLIIDLRNNGGGNSILGDQFARFLELPNRELTSCSSYTKVSKLMQAGRLSEYEYELKEMQKINPAIEIPFLTNKDCGTFPESCISDNEHSFYFPEQSQKFAGRLFILTGHNTFSSACGFATVLQDNGLAVVIGEPTGGKPTCFGDVLYFELPNTKIECGVSHKEFFRPDESKNHEDSLYPDYPVEYDYAEKFHTGRDVVFERALELINNG